ncbi:MAG: type VI secretion system lipoprotein TssJ [Candidatus Heimdallarchaeota archaeon]|nr:type VI secretion system lipoprotein TssJ [Candidatus Heimdallarchaeota archaeon]
MLKLILMKKLVLAFGIISATLYAGDLTADESGMRQVILKFTMKPDGCPDENMRPSPLIIHAYQLKAIKNFNKTDFVDMLERDTNVLGDQLVNKQRLTHLTPGEVRGFRIILNKDTRYIGLFAEFSRYKNSKYKLVFPVVKNHPDVTTVNIQISGNRMDFLN